MRQEHHLKKYTKWIWLALFIIELLVTALISFYSEDPVWLLPIYSAVLIFAFLIIATIVGAALKSIVCIIAVCIDDFVNWLKR